MEEILDDDDVDIKTEVKYKEPEKKPKDKSTLTLDEIERQIENCTDDLYDAINEKDKSVLSNRRIELLQMKIENMNEQKKRILSLTKKMPTDQFKKKIDLTGKCDKPDLTLSCTIEGRTRCKKDSGYKPLPKELETLDKSKNKKSLFGNKPMPTELQKKLW